MRKKIAAVSLLIGLISSPVSASSIQADYNLSYGSLGDKSSMRQEVSVDLEDKLSRKNYWFARSAFNIRSNKDNRWVYRLDKIGNSISIGFGNRLWKDYLRMDAGIAASFWDRRFRGGFSLGADGIWSKGSYHLGMLTLGRDILIDAGSRIDIYPDITADISIQNSGKEWALSAGPGYSIKSDKINTDISLLFTYRDGRPAREISGGINMALSFAGDDPMIPDSYLYRTDAPQSSFKIEIVPIGDYISCTGRCSLEKKVEAKLRDAERIADEKGYDLKIISSLRNIEEQRALNDKYGNRACSPDYESCSHVKGMAVDITIPQLKDKLGCAGIECEDNPFYNPEDKYQRILREIMVSSGFTPSPFEWWHFEG